MPVREIPDRRRARTLATRAAIRRAALELVAEHGLDAVTVECIVERAGVGYRTFFNHFACKEDAVVDGGQERADAMLCALRARPSDEPVLTTVREVFLQEAASVEDREDELALRFAVLESSPVLKRRFHAEFAVIEQTIADAIAERTGIDIEQSFYPQALAATACTLLRAAVLRWRAGGGSSALPRGALVDLVAEAFDLLTVGMAAPFKQPAAAPHR